MIRESREVSDKVENYFTKCFDDVSIFWAKQVKLMWLSSEAQFMNLLLVYHYYRKGLKDYEKY